MTARFGGEGSVVDMTVVVFSIGFAEIGAVVSPMRCGCNVVAVVVDDAKSHIPFA